MSKEIEIININLRNRALTHNDTNYVLMEAPVCNLKWRPDLPKRTYILLTRDNYWFLEYICGPNSSFYVTYAKDTFYAGNAKSFGKETQVVDIQRLLLAKEIVSTILPSNISFDELLERAKKHPGLIHKWLRLEWAIHRKMEIITKEYSEFNDFCMVGDHYKNHFGLDNRYYPLIKTESGFIPHSDTNLIAVTNGENNKNATKHPNNGYLPEYYAINSVEQFDEMQKIIKEFKILRGPLDNYFNDTEEPHKCYIGDYREYYRKIYENWDFVNFELKGMSLKKKMPEYIQESLDFR